MSKEMQITSVVIESHETFDLETLSKLTQLRTEVIIEFVEHGVLDPEGDETNEWQFSALDLKRSQKAWRLHQDLHINSPGLALVLDLLEELESLR